MPFIGAVRARGKRLKFICVLTLRFLPLLPIYVILSLSYSLINLAFQIPVNGNGYANFGPQGGFMSMSRAANPISPSPESDTI